jgi:UDP-4-amino-4,6-dideoxy-N-acetyl-beta-L-altrosamine N-acetyltransferase
MLRIEPLTEDHIQTVRVWRNQPEIKNYFIYDKDISEEEQIKWFEKYEQDDKDHCFIVFEGDNPIGFVGLYIDNDWKIAEFGRLMIGEKSAWGKGYGTEITEMACNYAFEQLNIELVYLEVFEDNTRAIKAYESVGFKVKNEQKEERGKKMVVMALHVTEL